MKNNKGFTLIELLVVVAIIGILAPVGTVAYTGYTEGAKKSSAKSNHASAVKYIAAEDQKCSIGATTAMDGNLTCDGRTGGTIALAAALALKDFKNPWSTSRAAIRPNTDRGDGTADAGKTATADADRGYVNIVVDATDSDLIIVTTCFDDSTGGTATACKEAKDRVENKVAVAE